jgi:hypothetical protein
MPDNSTHPRLPKAWSTLDDRSTIVPAAAIAMPREGRLRMLSAQEIVALHDEMTRQWHNLRDTESASALPDTASEQKADAEWLSLVARQHRANFDLWHIEDEARTPGATDAELAEVKRRIDKTNQLRNDLVEELDRTLLSWLAERGLPNAEAPVHSETAGLIIDRLSILALKIFHTREEADRPEAPPGHAERNRERLTILEEQRHDLANCLDALWLETLQGTRRFKLYRQLKMYNDPLLNPSIYGKTAARQGR